ncbi:cupin domain-containing protein [Streptomyces niveus]|uniref:cupin domain-containing protein n=1 Tax=Streptomyces niveus TaxID=193462 RepID=UPI003655EC8F
MLVTEFVTDVVEAPERFALWEEVTAQSHMRNLMRSNNQNNFRAKMRNLDLGEAQVSSLAFPHLEIVRTAKLVRRSDPEVYLINYILGGKGGVSLGGRDTVLQPGDLMMLDSSRLYHAHRYAHQDNWSQLTVQCPRRLLPLPEKTVQRLLAIPISGRSGMGGVFARWLTDLNARADEFTPADIPTLTSVTLDLLASVIARCLEAEESLTPGPQDRSTGPDQRIRRAAARQPGHDSPDDCRRPPHLPAPSSVAARRERHFAGCLDTPPPSGTLPP